MEEPNESEAPQYVGAPSEYAEAAQVPGWLNRLALTLAALPLIWSVLGVVLLAICLLGCAALALWALATGVLVG